MGVALSRRDALAGAVALAAAPPAHAASRVAQIPLRLSYNLPWATGRVNGKAGGPFLISTGLARVWLAPEVVAISGAPRLKREISDTALGAREADVHIARRVTVGAALQLDDLEVTSLHEGFGDPDFEGAIGGIFSRVTAGFDFQERTLTLARRSGFDTREHAELRLLGGPPTRTVRLSEFSTYGAIETLALEENATFDPRPIVRVTIDDREVRLLLDTGYAGSVLLYEAAPDGAAPESQVWLFGAGPSAKLSRAREVAIAGFVVPEPVIEHVYEDVRTSHSGAGVDGLIGMELLRRFHVVLNFAEEAIWLRPNTAFGDQIRYNKSGMSLTKQRAEVLVANVTTNGSAWAAGLRPGDRLLNWPGAASLRALQASFSQHAGSQVELLARRGQRTATVAVELHDIV